MRRSLSKRLTGLRRRLLGVKTDPQLSACVSLKPARQPIGRVLLAYIVEPFLRSTGRLPSGHTHFRESELMVQGWLDAGFAVDVIDYKNGRHQPNGRYDFFVSARTNLCRIAERLNDDCKVVAHFDTSHFAANNRLAYRRLFEFQERRGICLPESIRLIETNLALERCDEGIVLGSEVTAATYAYAKKPLHTLSVPGIVHMPAPSPDGAPDRGRHFLWIGSSGLLHKGLDVAIEAFATMPDARLTVCGPLSGEPRFIEHYSAEAGNGNGNGNGNIDFHGWVDVTGETFRNLAATCSAVIYPSIAEGQAGSVVNAMLAGLIPVVTREAGISVDGFGEYIDIASVDDICSVVRRFESLPDHELHRRMEDTWRYAQAYHTDEAYAGQYGRIVARLTA